MCRFNSGGLDQTTANVWTHFQGGLTAALEPMEEDELRLITLESRADDDDGGRASSCRSP